MPETEISVCSGIDFEMTKFGHVLVGRDSHHSSAGLVAELESGIKNALGEPGEAISLKLRCCGQTLVA